MNAAGTGPGGFNAYAGEYGVLSTYLPGPVVTTISGFEVGETLHFPLLGQGWNVYTWTLKNGDGQVVASFQYNPPPTGPYSGVISYTITGLNNDTTLTQTITGRNGGLTTYYAAYGNGVTCDPPAIVDTDGDGYPDDLDAFPNDPDEWADTDLDGVGDNGDAFPMDPAESVDTDGDGVGDNADACDTSDLSLTVVIGGQDTFVFNELFEDGCTITDLINGLAGAAGNHGAFVSSVAHLTNDLKSRGVITNKEKAAIQKAAAQSGR
ncbi:MAG TPA: hypothetical protein DDZ88_26540 [Verrucomicrobiales bacterium]|nr:hypothetical protein [Verrucomicrobiales bacterium]